MQLSPLLKEDSFATDGDNYRDLQTAEAAENT